MLKVHHAVSPIVALFLLLCCVTGCGRGLMFDSFVTPKKLPHRSSLACILEDYYSNESWYTEYDGLSNEKDTKNYVKDATQREQIKFKKRNEHLKKLILLVDEYYHTFCHNIDTVDRAGNLAGDTATQGLTGVAALIPDALTKSILAALAGGVSAFGSSVNENFFLEQSMSAIIDTMDAGRIEKRKVLEAGMKLKTDEYSLETGLNDLMEYYLAGTIHGALRSLKGSTINKLKTEQKNRSDDLEKKANPKEDKDILKMRVSIAQWIDKADKPTTEKAIAHAKGNEKSINDITGLLKWIEEKASIFDLIAFKKTFAIE